MGEASDISNRKKVDGRKEDGTLLGASGHGRTGFLSAEFRHGSIQETDLVEEIHSWTRKEGMEDPKRVWDGGKR